MCLTRPKSRGAALRPSGYPMPEAAGPRPKTLSAARRPEPGRAEGQPERQLHERRMDYRGARGASVGAGPGEVLWQVQGHMTMSKRSNPVAAISNGRPAPVRVKHRRISASLAKA